MSDVFDLAPDENETFESLDEEDAQRGFVGRPEGERDLGIDCYRDVDDDVPPSQRFPSWEATPLVAQTVR